MMKIFASLFLLLSSIAHAETLTAPLLQTVVDKVEHAELKSLGKGLYFGDESIQSCAYGSSDLLVVVHYCGPGTYPARGVTVWSPDLGEIELYAQDFGTSGMKRDVRLNQFPELVQKEFSMDFSKADFPAINAVASSLYNAGNPACWSTNFDYATLKPTAGCGKTDLALYPAWAADAQEATAGTRWDEAYTRLLKAVQK